MLAHLAQIMLQTIIFWQAQILVKYLRKISYNLRGRWKVSWIASIRLTPIF